MHNSCPGIMLGKSSNNTIINNIVNDNSGGIDLWNSSNNDIANNTIVNNNVNGIYIICNSSFNNVLNNEILNNNRTGIEIIADVYYYSWSGNVSMCSGGSDNTIQGNTISNNNIGIYSQNSNSTINLNVVCGNINLDFNSSDWLSSSGDNNTCDNADGWNDEGIESSCTFRCPVLCDSDNDYYTKAICGGTDCNDSNKNVNPEATEICDDTIDNDCDSDVDMDDGDCSGVICICRDANGDGVIDNLDITKVERIVAGLDPDPVAPANADANCDGVIDNLDITKVERIVAGLDSICDTCTC